jgi:hypothetical protein
VSSPAWSGPSSQPPSRPPSPAELARRRTDRVRRQAARTAPLVNDTWISSVLSHLHQAAGPEVSSLAPSDCAALARLATRLLKGKPPHRNGFLALFLGPSPHEELAAAIMASLELSGARSKTATGRALESVGIAVCRQAGIGLESCPCFQAPAGDEDDALILMLLRLAVGDWTGLADAPLTLLESH